MAHRPKVSYDQMFAAFRGALAGRRCVMVVEDDTSRGTLAVRLEWYRDDGTFFKHALLGREQLGAKSSRAIGREAAGLAERDKPAR